MATIKAEGDTYLGKIDVTIKGGDKVKSVDSSDEYVASFFKERIARADGRIANGYRPEANTMLQAYASCLLLFKEKDIEIDGDIGEIEYEEGVIY